MAYKFNRDCWVESQIERALKDAEAVGNDAPVTAAGDRDEPAAQRVALARSLYTRFGDRLRADARVQDLAARLAQALRASHSAMANLGILAACARCDAITPEGSCCSRGLENKLDTLLLLMNLLLGVELPTTRAVAGSCLFLSPTGCTLKLRHMLCIDYLCPELEAALGHARLVTMQTVSGVEIECAFHLGEAVRRLLLSRRN